MITELRHIWTDGRFKLSRAGTSDNMTWKWIWDSTNKSVPEIGGFFPWCSADQCRDNAENCLNLDREVYTPVVYGLACNQSQTYVCQPRESAFSLFQKESEIKSENFHKISNKFRNSRINAKSLLRNNFETHPRPLGPLHFFPNRYYYYPRYRVRSDRKQISSYRNKDPHNYIIMSRKIGSN